MDFAYLVSASATDIGRHRSKNEDALLDMPEKGLFCVADGMGGVKDGEVASQAVVDSLRKAFVADAGDKPQDRPDTIKNAVSRAGQWIKQHAIARGAPGAGTTVVVLLFDSHGQSSARAYHAGDSRLYRFRNGALTQITKDHSFAEAAGVKSEDDLPPMFRGLVTRAVGIEDSGELEETILEFRRGDIFLLCSDGLTRMVKESAICDMVGRNHLKKFEMLPQLLVKAANNAGGADNISVIAVKVGDSLEDGAHSARQ